MEENEQLVLNWFSKLAGGHINLGTLSDFMKNTCRKCNIQFRKIDPRRSENIVLGINQDCLRKQKKVLVSYLDYDRTAYSLLSCQGTYKFTGNDADDQNTDRYGLLY